MKEHYTILPLGQEQQLNLGFGNTCPACNVQRVNLYNHGCIDKVGSCLPVNGAGNEMTNRFKGVFSISDSPRFSQVYE